MAIEIVSFPIENGDCPYYVKLLEGMWNVLALCTWWWCKLERQISWPYLNSSNKFQTISWETDKLHEEFLFNQALETLHPPKVLGTIVHMSRCITVTCVICMFAEGTIKMIPEHSAGQCASCSRSCSKCDSTSACTQCKDCQSRFFKIFTQFLVIVTMVFIMTLPRYFLTSIFIPAWTGEPAKCKFIETA